MWSINRILQMLIENKQMKHLIEKSFDKEMCNKTFSDGSEIKCGRLFLVQLHKGKQLKVQVFVRVYRSSYEHYVVLYKDQKYSLQSGYISLKNCLVNKCTGKDNQVQVTLNDYEGTGVVFESWTSQEADEWIDALQPQIMSSSPPSSFIFPCVSPIIPRSPLMPTLEEESDEDV